MKVQIALDTEKEDLAELKKLAIWVQELIEQREKGPSSAETPNFTPSKPIPISQPNIQQQKPAGDRTSAGGNVIPYEDMSGMLSKIASGEKLR